MRNVILLLTVILAGCSGISESTYLEPINDGTLCRVHVHDWYEKETTGPSIGAYRPPIYAYNYNSEYYVIYPLLVNTGPSAIGPPVLPVIPVKTSDQSKLYEQSHRIRHYKKNGIGSIKPIKVTLLNGDEVLGNCTLKFESKDLVGSVYICPPVEIPEEMSKLQLELALFDGHKKLIELEKRTYNMYSPLLSFNSPEPRPSIFIEDK